MAALRVYCTVVTSLWEEVGNGCVEAPIMPNHRQTQTGRCLLGAASQSRDSPSVALRICLPGVHWGLCVCNTGGASQVLNLQNLARTIRAIVRHLLKDQTFELFLNDLKIIIIKELFSSFSSLSLNSTFQPRSCQRSYKPGLCIETTSLTTGIERAATPPHGGG